jgi:hypothetical protein
MSGAPEHQISELVESHPSQHLIKSQPLIFIEASSWGWGHPFNGRSSLDRPIFLVELVKTSTKCSSGRNWKLTMENSRRPKSGGLGPSVVS